jgi:hypothetical protein
MSDSEWRSFDTAPKDGSVIWLGTSWADTAGFHGQSVAAVYWNIDAQVWSPVGYPGYSVPDDGGWKPWNCGRKPEPPPIPSPPSTGEPP